MGIIDFEFKRERKLGEFVQDFINLLKLIYKHLVVVLFRLLVIPICLILLLSYYISTQLSFNADYSDQDYFNIAMTIGGMVLGVMIVSLFAIGFAIEYFILMRDRKSIDFNHSDVWNQFKQNIYYYFRYFGAMLVVGILVSIPVAIGVFLAALIPFIGSFAAGILFSIIGLWFFVAFMLYREGYYDLMDCFGSALTVIKSKMLEYGLASYIVSFIFQSMLGIMAIMPAVIFFVISYNFIGFDNNFFESGLGRMIATGGGLLITLLFIVYYMMAVLSYGIIYETAKELQFGEDVYERIEKLGGEKNA